MDDVRMSPVTGRDPFPWLRLLSVECDNGLRLSTIFLCMFRATQFGHGSEFGKFLDDMPHSEDDHRQEGPCFKCVLKDLELESFDLCTVQDQASYFVRALSKWCYEQDNDCLFTKLHELLELWSLEKPGWGKKFFKIFSVQTHDKNGCRDCFDHFSEPQGEHLFDAGEKSIELFLQHTTSVVRRLCSFCGHPARYVRKSFRRLPMCLVFTKTCLPLLELHYREVAYRLTVVVPEVDKFKVYLLSKNEWAEMDLKENRVTMKPLAIMDEWPVLELVFYTKVLFRECCNCHVF